MVNEELKKVSLYFRQHGLALHPEKNKFLVFTNSQDVKNMNIPIYIDSNNFNTNEDDKKLKIERVLHTDNVPAIRFLGIYFDCNLNFQYHTKLIISKLSKALYILRTAKNILPEKALLSIYYALFHPHIIYCLPIWSVTQQKTLSKISSMQKQAIRIIANLNYNAHTEPSFKKLQILPLNSLIFYFNLQIMQRYIQGFLPSAFNDTWIKNSQRQVNENGNDDIARRLRNRDELYLPPCRLTTIAKFPYYNLPRIWHNFDNETIKIIRNKPEFNQSLKKHLLHMLNDTVICNRLLCPSCHLKQT